MTTTIDLPDLADLADVRELFASGRAREIREEARIKQAEMARAIGVDPSTYCYWERGSRVPHISAANPALEILTALAARKPVTL
jgi:transcriptional regulator with XRE-family HTH domain